MHFYFFALLAMLAVYANPLVILAATVTVALHHLALWFLLPASVFNYEAPIWVVLVHAAFVVLEATATCFIARSFFDNVIGLEKIVQNRTAELDARNAEMRLVLDNVDQGFVSIDRSGVLSPERSAAFGRWFGDAEPGRTLFDHLEGRFPAFASQSRIGFDQLIDGFLPIEMTLDQMPGELTTPDSTWRLDYRPIGDAEQPERFLLVVTDVTAERARVRAEQERKETLHVLERMLTDRSAFQDFLEEGTELVEVITRDATSTDVVVLKRGLHTLKGNAAIFGLESVASLCHEMETQMVEGEGLPKVESVSDLQARWERLSADVQQLGGGRAVAIEIDEAEHKSLVEAIACGQPRADLLRRVHELKLEPTRSRLDHFAEQARRIAARVDKPAPEVTIDHAGVRLEPKQWARFWSAFVHVIRNAVDHGIESVAERNESGKPEHGTLRLRTAVTSEGFLIEVTDDGRGIDWDRVSDKAQKLGLPRKTRADLEHALFADGVSTAARVSDISGRGVGLGAVLAVTKDLGGSVSIDSGPGRGTTFRMVFPVEAMSPSLSQLLADAA